MRTKRPRGSQLLLRVCLLIAACFFFIQVRKTAFPSLTSSEAQHGDARAVDAKQECDRWHEQEIVHYLSKHHNRAHFADLFRKGCFRSGMEVGVADGRFSEHFLEVNSKFPLTWYMIEPYPNSQLKQRFWISEAGTADFSNGSWARRGIGSLAHMVFVPELSTDERLIRDIADNSIDFIYLDGAHDHENVYRELTLYYRKIKPGGVLAGHDYCNYGEDAERCNGCENVPRCGGYTEYGLAHGKPAGKLAVNQAGVVKAVHRWMMNDEPQLKIHFTSEDFTRDSLANDAMDYDLVITSTRNPSWYFIKPRHVTT